MNYRLHSTDSTDSKAFTAFTAFTARLESESLRGDPRVAK